MGSGDNSSLDRKQQEQRLGGRHVSDMLKKQQESQNGLKRMRDQ